MDKKREVLMVFHKGINGLGDNGVENFYERDLEEKRGSYLRQEEKRHDRGLMVEATFSKFCRLFSSYTVIKH